MFQVDLSNLDVASHCTTGPWTQKAKISTCYYDAGLIIDDDDTMYIAYGNIELSIDCTQKSSPINIGLKVPGRVWAIDITMA